MAYPVVQWKRFQESTETDEWGEEVSGFADPVEIQAAFAPESTAESSQSGLAQRVISQAKLYLKTPIDYTARDEFLIDGKTYRAVGESPGWYGLYSRRAFGQEILLEAVTG
ncbi:hypothetical protein VVR12_01795 [Rothia sp. LK2588]|uniref:hypothetical protein n=1 Tax=Rothia sp. LK2588 TaxID=3114369 RepID=UPI0034CF2A32